jgi:hypothetical protein
LPEGTSDSRFGTPRGEAIPSAHRPSGRFPRRLALLTALATALTTLLLAEIVLRAAGHGPWQVSTLDAREPVMNQPDPVRGWRNRPGRYVIPPYTAGGRETEIHILPDGSRATGAGEPDGRRVLVLVGGSYTRGNGLSDEQTSAWKLQARFPELRVQNHGTGGYGTYQSLLALEEILPRSDVAFVLYGFIDHHEVRNVAPPGWIDLLSRFSRRRQVRVPYCTLDARGELVRHPPASYPAWPLRRWLATVAFAERAVAYAGGSERAAQGRAVTERLLVEMEARSRRHGSGFAVVLLSVGPDAKAHYPTFLARSGIRVADCARPVTAAYQVPGEGHPNDRLTTIWSRCIERELGDVLRALSDRTARVTPGDPGAKDSNRGHASVRGGARRDLRAARLAADCARSAPPSRASSGQTRDRRPARCEGRDRRQLDPLAGIHRSARVVVLAGPGLLGPLQDTIARLSPRSPHPQSTRTARTSSSVGAPSSTALAGSRVTEASRQSGRPTRSRIAMLSMPG